MKHRILAWLAFGLAGHSVFAQDAEPVSPPTPPARRVEFTLQPSSRAQFNAGIGDGPGDVGVFKLGLDTSVAIPADPRGTLTIGLENEYARYDFDAATTLTPGGLEPMSDAWSRTLTIGYARQENDRWGWRAEAGINSSMANGADFSESLTFGGIASFTYAVRPTLVIGAGVGVFSQLEQGVRVIPVPVIIWRVDERWTLSNSEGGAGVMATYALSEQVQYFAQAEFDFSGGYRLDEDGPLPGGVLIDEGLSISAGGRWRTEPWMLLQARVGASFARTIETLDSNGDTFADEDVDPSLFAAIDVRLTF